jgi:hypothetical protein
MVPLNLDVNKKETNGSVKTVASRIQLLENNRVMAINIDNICAIAELKQDDKRKSKKEVQKEP